MRIIRHVAVIILALAIPSQVFSQRSISKVWTADNGDGTYNNPILHADYSDPDVVRVGEDYYMTTSSFNCVPGLPVLHSRDLGYFAVREGITNDSGTVDIDWIRIE